MGHRYDLAVIGAGSTGLPAAAFARQLGARVVLVESDRVGGDCTWTGCVPSKALLHAAKVAHQMRHADSVGLDSVQPRVDLAKVMAGVGAAIQRVYAFETPEVLAKDGVEVVQGQASFRGPHALDVGGRILHSKRSCSCRMSLSLGSSIRTAILTHTPIREQILHVAVTVQSYNRIYRRRAGNSGEDRPGGF